MNRSSSHPYRFAVAAWLCMLLAGLPASGEPGTQPAPKAAPAQGSAAPDAADSSKPGAAAAPAEEAGTLEESTRRRRQRRHRDRNPFDVDWEQHSAVDSVLITTADADGRRRETKIWMVVIDNQAYIRTGDTRWFANIQRDNKVTVRVGSLDYRLRVKHVKREALAREVEAAFRAKYGVTDRMTGLIRRGETHIMALKPRNVRRVY